MERHYGVAILKIPQYQSVDATYRVAQDWLRGTVVERQSFGRRTSLSCAQPVADR